MFFSYGGNTAIRSMDVTQSLIGAKKMTFQPLSWQYDLNNRAEIDDEPICEVDFNADHLRLNLAVLHSQDAGETPYEDIGELCKVDDRNRIKKFITVSMGANDESEAFNALKIDGFNAKLFDTIKQGTLKRYPKINLFEGWGLSAQNLEGAILRKVMLEGIEQDIVSLHVHDAIAVKQSDADWAKEAMERVWSDETLGGKTRLKVDYPDQFESENNNFT